jgi:hypothetical protein
MKLTKGVLLVATILVSDDNLPTGRLPLQLGPCITYWTYWELARVATNGWCSLKTPVRCN